MGLLPLCKLNNSNNPTYVLTLIAAKNLSATFSAKIGDIFTIFYLGSRWTSGGSGCTKIGGLSGQSTTVGSATTKSDLLVYCSNIDGSITFSNAGGTVYKYMGVQVRYIKK